MGYDGMFLCGVDIILENAILRFPGRISDFG